MRVSVASGDPGVGPPNDSVPSMTVPFHLFADIVKRADVAAIPSPVREPTV